MVKHVGKLFGKYKLQKRVAQGGTADVYHGKHLYLKIDAAVKIPRGPASYYEKQSLRFEAQTIASLLHPHIVGFYDFGIKNGAGIPYLVMQYADDGSLRKIISRGQRLSLSATLHYIRPIGNALTYIHQQGYVHLDVKPDNILLSKNGNILLGDFGITVMARSASNLNLSNLWATFAYMDPHRLWDDPIHLNDQYSLAVVTYELLAGHLPFYGSRQDIQMQQMQSQPPPLRSYGVSRSVENIVFKAMKADPQARFASVQEFIQALDDEQKRLPSIRTLHSRGTLQSLAKNVTGWLF